MVREIEFTDFAKRKLKSIFKYYSENVSDNVATKLVKSIVSSTDRLIKFDMRRNPKILEQEMRDMND